MIRILEITRFQLTIAAYEQVCKEPKTELKSFNKKKIISLAADDLDWQIMFFKPSLAAKPAWQSPPPASAWPIADPD